MLLMKGLYRVPSDQANVDLGFGVFGFGLKVGSSSCSLFQVAWPSMSEELALAPKPKLEALNPNT